MYTICVGQNPTGTTMGTERKKQIYDICVKYDVLIVEDEPYYQLQLGNYGEDDVPSLEQEMSIQNYVKSLAPSYLKFDYQGRVIRLDTFSKTVAPGCRMGWITTNPLFAERLLRISETSTQSACGFGQVSYHLLMPDRLLQSKDK